MNQFELEKRREEIRRLKIMGVSNVRICEMLGLPSGTLYNDLAIINETEKKLTDSNKKLMEEAAKGILEMLSKYQLIEKEGWINYLAINAPCEKMKALTILAKIYMDVAKLLKLVDYNQVNIEKYINIENLTPILNNVVQVVELYVPEDKRKEAFEMLKRINIQKDEEK
jgi:hypothetical protein